MLACQHVLVINPNTSESVTQHLSLQLSGGLPEVQIHGQTAAFGMPYIATEHSYCIAGHAVLDAWERAAMVAPAPGYSALLVGCFGDPGLHGLREVAQRPVLGLAEDAVEQMWRQGFERIAVVTGGTTWKPMLERWSRAAGYAGAHAGRQIVQVTALPANGMQMMQSPQEALQALVEASRTCLQATDAQAVLLGGAGLAGMGAQVRTLSGLPVWDCLELVTQRLQLLLEQKLHHLS
ncbi:MAG: aspartate/glutamate racemase family protein [Comamonadaceae bacterium]|nr:aspartate/glutamate racemase family protein [Comamonadaceae bacterium]